MTWFRVDDQFFNHPKVLGLDMAARGLWVSAGAYCAAYLTDGVITDRQIRAIGGTRKQAEKLVSAGLWSADDAPPSARRYVFNDWRDFQPTRGDVLAKRQEARDRMAEARAKKAKARENAKMFARTNSERSQNVRSSGLSERSHYPGPARPGPARPNTSEEVISQPYGPNAREEAGGDLSLDEFAAATRRAREAGISEDAIRDGTRRFQTKPEPKGPGLLRTLINEAEAEHQATAAARDEAAARRAAIEACEQCDDNGLRPVPGGVARCNHQPPLKAVGGPF